MKKILLMASLLSLGHSALASCVTTIDWHIYAKNTTSHNLAITDCAGNTGSAEPQPNAPSAYTATGETGIGGANTIQCTYTDNDNNQTGYLILTFNTCTDITASVTNTTMTPSTNTTAFACSTPHVINNSADADVSAYFTVAPTATYTLVWNNIITNLAKGQTMAVKLANDLTKKGSSFGSPTANYDGKKITITVKNGNPYETCSTWQDCQKINNGTS